MLVSDYATNGARYSKDAYLPHTKGKKGMEMTGGEFVRAKLLKPGFSDPDLGCEKPDKLVDYAWQFLTKNIAPEWVELAQLYYELRSKGVKLPAIDVGWSVEDVPFAMRG